MRIFYKNKPAKKLLTCLIALMFLLNISPAFSRNMNNVSEKDIDAAKEFLKEKDQVEKDPPLIIKSEVEKEIPKTSVVSSEIEKALTGDLILDKPLEQFGYDTFKKTVSTFAPVTDVPVGPDYIIGPGDAFTITLWGISEGIYNVKVNREGNITIPKAGVVHVAGLQFGDLKHFILAKLARYYESINISIAIDNVRTIQVYVLGEVENPGMYTLSSLASAYSALLLSKSPRLS